MTQLEITELLRAATKDLEQAIDIVNDQISQNLNPRIANYNLVVKLAEEYRVGTVHKGIGDEHARKRWQSLEIFEVEVAQLVSHIRTQISNVLLKFETLPIPTPSAGGKPV